MSIMRYDINQVDVCIQQLAERITGSTPAEITQPVFIGVDVGTANVISVAVDAKGVPLAGEMTPARVVREGMVTDYFGAIHIVCDQINKLETRLGTKLTVSASAIPPGTEQGNVKVTKNILEAADLTVTKIIDEPTAAALVLGIDEGIVVDVGGGTTGISILERGKVIYTADEPTGGFQLDLVIAGHFGITLEEAEGKKRDQQQQKKLLPIVRPVFEKISRIVQQHIAGYKAKDLFLVGGTCGFPGFDKLLASETGLRTYLPRQPLLVTPLGIALACRAEQTVTNYL